ncbi:DUF4249 domain-containing protein [Flavobacterium sp. U410]
MLIALAIRCTEPYSLNTENFEDYLVVEATITNEYKHHKITLTRTFPLENEDIPYEHNATVYISDSEGNSINFDEEDNSYISETEFSAEAGKSYTLHIKTTDGEEYVSENVQLTTATSLSSVNAVRMNYYGVDGVAILVNSYDPNNASQFYRYEYEETSKIVVPKPSNDSLVVSGYDENTYTFSIDQRTSESKTCFKTVNSNDILQYSTVDQNEDRVNAFIIRFISKDDYTIANGYSILAKQYIQSSSSYFYYKTLNDINASGEILSPMQPGFLYGNLSCTTNSNKKVVGFFDMSFYSESRVYFDFEDIFPSEPHPQYPFECTVSTYDATLVCPPGGSNCNDTYGKYNLGSLTRGKNISLFLGNHPYYDMVLTECTDCRILGSNVQPPFWP